jgi:hypothetical protein
MRRSYRIIHAINYSFHQEPTTTTIGTMREIKITTIVSIGNIKGKNIGQM